MKSRVQTEPFLKPVLKRGALVAAANWQVTLIQATADSLFKLLIATPLIGGLFLVGLVIGSAPQDLLSLEWREMAATIISSLLSHPVVLTAFLASLAVVVVGGSLFIFLVKAGAVAVLVRGERDAGPIEQPPLHFDVITRASKFSAEFYIESARSLFPRYARLGFILMAVYLVSAGFYLAAAYESGVRGDLGGVLTLVMTIGFVSWITTRQSRLPADANRRGRRGLQRREGVVAYGRLRPAAAARRQHRLRRRAGARAGGDRRVTARDRGARSDCVRAIRRARRAAAAAPRVDLPRRRIPVPRASRRSGRICACIASSCRNGRDHPSSALAFRTP